MDDMTPSPRPPLGDSPEAPGQDLRQMAADRLAASHEQIERSRRLIHHIGGVPIRAPDGDIRPNAVSDRLAAQPIPLVDRTEVLAAIRTSFMVERVRLLTVTGPAGVGKTRVAVEAAAQLVSEFSGGVVAVELSYVREPGMVLPAVAHALGVSHTSSVPLMVRLRTFLADRRLLLLLDNFEHVLSAASRLGDMLIGCPDLAMLVTSRTPLHLRWEHVLRIAPLPVPDLTRLPPLDELAKVPAVALFLERARARGADFALNEERAALVAQLVVHLNGLPLALELAAARLDTLPLPLLTRQLRDRLQVLEAPLPDAPTRQRSLEAAIGWSYGLLNADEQHLFRQVGVFAGVVTLDAIAAVAAMGASTRHAEDDRVNEGRALPELLSLAEQSLLLPPRPAHFGWQQGGVDEEADDGEEEAGPAFGMLETVREYAAERLAAAGELESARRAHAYFFLELAERADAKLRGPHQRAWFFRMEREHDNLRAALRWLLDQQDDPAALVSALRLVGALGYFWWLRGYHAEGAHWLEEVLGRVPHVGEEAGEEAGEDAAGTTVRTVALCWAGALLTLRGDLERACARLEEARTHAEQVRNPVGIARALTFLGQRAVYAADVERAVPLLEEALRVARTLGEPHHVGIALFFLSVATHASGQAAEAAMHYAEALGLFEAAGDERLAGAVHIELGVIAGQQDDLGSALRHLRAGLEASGRLRDRWLLSLSARAVLAVVGDGASAQVDEGDPVGRARLVGAADALRQATGGGRVPWESAGADQTAVALRAPLTDAERETAYREGRSLSAKEVAHLALHLLEEAAAARSYAEPGSSVAETTRQAAAAARSDQITSREVEVLRLVAQGLANKAIARQLSISPSTVNYHLTAIFNKLVVDTRAQAVAVAVRRGLL